MLKAMKKHIAARLKSIVLCLSSSVKMPSGSSEIATP
jgi:hypothetical protein